MTAPIGFVLARAQRAIDAAFDAAFAADGLTRRHWQLLSTLESGPATGEELADAVRPFLRDGVGVSGELAERGARRAVTQDAGRWRLTEEGRALATRVGEKVADIRTRMSAGLSRDDYERTLEVLERIATNLEPDEVTGDD